MIVTVADRQLEWARSVQTTLAEKGYRVVVDDRGLSMQKKIAEAQVQKVPFTLVIGDREVEQGSVAPRRYAGGDLKAMPLAQFLELFEKEARLP